MMKKSIFVVCITISILIVYGAWHYKEKELFDYPWEIGSKSEDVIYNDKDICFEIKSNSLSPTGAVFVLQNLGQEAVMYDANDYVLQIQIKGKWYNIEEYADWPLEMLTINGKSQIEISICWNEIYGEVPPGKYRVIKKVFSPEESFILSEEFQI